MQFNLEKTEVETLRKDFTRYIQIDFVVKSQTFACHTDLDQNGGLAHSSTFYKMEDGKPDQFLFWTNRAVDDPNIAEYVFTEFFAKDGLTAESDGAQALMPSAVAPTKPHKKPKRRFAYQHVKKYDVTKQFSSEAAYQPLSYGILRLENDKECLDGFAIESLEADNADLIDLHKPEAIKSLTFQSLGISKTAWLDAQGEFVRGDMVHQYASIDKGAYSILDETDTTKTLEFEGSKINGIYELDLVSKQIKFVGDQFVAKSYDLTSNDIKDVYEAMGINTQDMGCIMLDTQPIQVDDIIPENELYQWDEEHPDYLRGYVSQDHAHLTLLYGLMESGITWKPYVDAVLSGWNVDAVTIEDVGFFASNNPESEYYCLVAHITVTDDLLEGNARLKMLPHIDTFPDYKPHVTLAYINKNDVLRDEYIAKLNQRLAGNQIAVTGLNYGGDDE